MADNVEKKDDAKDAGAAEATPAKKDKPKTGAKAKSSAKKASDGGEKKSSDGSEKQPKAAKSASRRAPPPTTAALGKSITMFVVVVGVLAVGFALLGQERSGAQKGPSWKTGETVNLDITLTANDKRELSCASTEEIAGRRCGFENPSKAWTGEGSQDDKKTFRPYTSTDNVQFVAAGLWSEPALAGTLPQTRFTVKCKYTIEGKLKAPTFHWESGWEGQPRGEMYAGLLSGCTLIP